MRAKLSATTAATFEYLIATGACSRLEPPPKFFPATNRSPAFTFLSNSGSNPYMAYFAISTGSLVRALNRNGMMMSVFTSSGQTQVLPRIIVDGGGRLIGISWDRQYALPGLMLQLSLGMRGRFWRLWLPFVPHNSVVTWINKLHSHRERRDACPRMRRMLRW